VSECKTLICENPGDLSVGANGDALYAQNQLTFLQGLPPGCSAPPGLFPKVFVYLPDQIPPVVPIGGSGSPFILRLQGCISEISRELPSTATQAQIRAAVDAIQAEWGGQQALCDARNTPGINCTPVFFNDEQTIGCGLGFTLNFRGLTVLNVATGPPGNAFGLNIDNHTHHNILGADYTFDNGVGVPPVGFGTVTPGTVGQRVLTVVVGVANAWTVSYQGVVFYHEASFTNDKLLTLSVYDDIFPPGITFDGTLKKLVMPSGIYAADTKAQANAIALAALQQIFDAAITSGVLYCS
jgi:hypothetical protein